MLYVFFISLISSGLPIKHGPPPVNLVQPHIQQIHFSVGTPPSSLFKHTAQRRALVQELQITIRVQFRITRVEKDAIVHYIR